MLKNKGKIFFFTFGLFFLTKSYATDLFYSIINIDPKSRKLTLELNLPEVTHETKLTTRATLWGMQDQIESPTCDNSILNKTNNVWIAPSHCKRITWQISPVINQNGIHVSKQLTATSPEIDWILFSEPTSLLKLVDNQPEFVPFYAKSSFFLAGAIPYNNTARLVPNDTFAPEFFVISDKKISIEKQDLNYLSVQYIEDNPEKIARNQLKIKHQRGLSYLLTLFNNLENIPINTRQIMVIWLGISITESEVGGASGYRSFVANYILDDDANEEYINNIKSMLVMFHEQFHQLSDMIRKPTQRNAVWIEESLAQYYALKTLQYMVLKYMENSEETAKIYTHFIQEQPIITSKLVKLQKAFEQGDQTSHPLFYSIGATFWAKLDTLLQEKLQNSKGLDLFVAELLLEGSESSSGLPPIFMQKINSIAKDEFQILLKQYVE